MTPSAEDLPRSWLAAIREPRVASALEAIYAEVARAIAERGPVCWASGRCCNFEKTGHRLYVTGLEAAYCVERRRPEHPALTVVSLRQARDRGGCPFQIGNLCGVHAIKPLGCRVYFCDRSAQQWQQELSERLHAEVKAIHDREGVEYRYAEWRGMLELFAI